MGTFTYTLIQKLEIRVRSIRNEKWETMMQNILTTFHCQHENNIKERKSIFVCVWMWKWVGEKHVVQR